MADYDNIIPLDSGAWTFMRKGTVTPENKIIVDRADELLHSVALDISVDGTFESLTSGQKFLLNKIRNMEIFCRLIEHTLSTKLKGNITYVGKDGELRIHPALAENYLAYSNAASRLVKQLYDDHNQNGQKKIDPQTYFKNLAKRAKKDNK